MCEIEGERERERAFQKKEELFISFPSLPLSLSLPRSSCSTTRGQMQNCKLAPGKIALIGRPHRLLVKVWADVSTIPWHSKQQCDCTMRKGAENKGREHSSIESTLCASINTAFQSVPELSELTFSNCTITHTNKCLSRHTHCNFSINQSKV